MKYLRKINATWYEELTHLKRPWCWERLRAGGEGDDRGWDGWMGSPTQWTWVWVDSGSWWWTGRPGVLWFTGLQRVGHNWATELNWMPNFLKFFQKGRGEETFKLILWGQHHPNSKTTEEKKSNTKTTRKEIYKPIYQPQKDKHSMIPHKSSSYNSQIHRIQMWSEDCQGPGWWSNRKLLMNGHEVSVK